MQALAKIGEELYLEPKPEGLALRTMNSSRSAVMSFKFDRHFFDYYEEKSEDDLQRIPDNTNPETSSQNPSKCRLMMRSILMVFNRLNVLVIYFLLNVFNNEKHVFLLHKNVLFFFLIGKDCLTNAHPRSAERIQSQNTADLQIFCH